MWASSSRAAAGLLCVAVLALADAAAGKVFYSREEAISLAFPDAERIETRTWVLDEGQVRRIQSIAKGELESRIVKIYTGMRGEDVLGYAFIDVHNVRTLPEAFLVVLTPEGEVRSLRVLAFHEPLEYLPAGRWYDQFEHKSLREPLQLGGDIHGIVGATLSARATTRGVRRALAFYEVLLENGR